MIVMGDLKAKVGVEQDPLQEIVEKHGLGKRMIMGTCGQICVPRMSM